MQVEITVEAMEEWIFGAVAVDFEWLLVCHGCSAQSALTSTTSFTQRRSREEEFTMDLSKKCFLLTK